jgi:hypothetical protein
MIWIMLATLAVVFVVGFRILTSDSRRAIKRFDHHRLLLGVKNRLRPGFRADKRGEGNVQTGGDFP